MSRFTKIKRKRLKVRMGPSLSPKKAAEVIAFVETYRDRRPGRKISIDQAYGELEKDGCLIWI